MIRDFKKWCLLFLIANLKNIYTYNVTNIVVYCIKVHTVLYTVIKSWDANVLERDLINIYDWELLQLNLLRKN